VERYFATFKVTLRAENFWSLEETRYMVVPSWLIHLVGKQAHAPGPMSHL
jgi:hypothetical protein